MSFAIDHDLDEVVLALYLLTVELSATSETKVLTTGSKEDILDHFSSTGEKERHCEPLELTLP